MRIKLKSSLPFLVLLLIVGVSACKTDKKEAKDSSQMKQVMAIHDEVMGKMGALSKLVAEINEKVDSTETGLKYEAAKKDLQVANKAMMDWMKGFGDRFTSDEIMNGQPLSEEKKQWLLEEEQNIKKVQSLFDNSMENAKKLLNKE